MGGVSEGDDVLARWSDGLLYLGNVKRVDGVKQCCLVRFEDNSEFWVLRKDIHSFSVGIEEVCCICDGPPLKEPLINCLKCRHGYHPECHIPSIDPDPDSNTWICRQCVFAVATKRGGALKRGRFARLMQLMKVKLPYQLSALDWDPQHLTNQQQCYCYCAGPGEWNLKMLQCGSCGQWFHEACTQCLAKPLLYGDRFYEFQCSACTNGPETIQRLPMSWVDLAHLVLYHLSLCCKRKYFDFDHEILSFTNENWESLLLGKLSDTPRQDRCHNLLNALNSHKDRFVSGKEIKKKKCLFGLQVRAPPPLTSDLSPLITDPPINISHRRSPVSSPCQRRTAEPESRKSKRRITEAQPHPQDVAANPIDLVPCYHGYADLLLRGCLLSITLPTTERKIFPGLCIISAWRIPAAFRHPAFLSLAHLPTSLARNQTCAPRSSCVMSHPILAGFLRGRGQRRRGGGEAGKPSGSWRDE
nr:PHD finger protein 1-like isoform X2 [Paramormyrops kingsleyae]